MDDRERAAAAQAFSVRPESIDQIQALGVDDPTTLQLLGLRDEAKLVVPIGSRVYDIRPPVREITNAYFLFGADEESLARIPAITQRYLQDIHGQFASGTRVPESYEEAQQLVTHSFQRSLYMEIVVDHILSVMLEEEGPSVVGRPLMRGVLGSTLAPSSVDPGIDIDLVRRVHEAEDRIDAEAAADAAIEAAIRLPDDDVPLRTPDNHLIVLSKADILLRFAQFRPGDEQFYAVLRAAVSANSDPFRAAPRKLALYYRTRNPDDLFDAGMTAFTTAGELLAQPVRSRIPLRHLLSTFNVLRSVVAERGEPVNPQGPEAHMMRGLLDRVEQLQPDTSTGWSTAARRDLAALTGDEVDIQRYRTADPSGYLDTYVRTDPQRLEPIVRERLHALEEAMGGPRIQSERAVQAAVGLAEIVRLFNHAEARQAVMGLDLSGFATSRASQVRNALCDALIANNDLDAAAEIAAQMTNARRRAQYIAAIAVKQSTQDGQSS